MHAFDWNFLSADPGGAWPALPGPRGAALLDLLLQLEHTQWLPPARIRELQARQLRWTLGHALETVPYYREHWRGAFDPAQSFSWERFAALPLLTRRDLQEHHDALCSRRVPAGHGRVLEGRSSGSTGTPVRFRGTELMQLFWHAITMREHAWHRRDLSARLAVIRHAKAPRAAGNWGPSSAQLVATGPAALLPSRTPVDEQLDWLAAQAPAYLLTYPSNAAELAKAALRRGLRLPALRQVRTIGELLDAEDRALVRQAWDVAVTDAYSSEETGYLALQCHSCERYHVQSESVLVELLDEAGRPCAAGETGRVVVTTLHGAAMPLVRYELGDYAVAGAPCACGRGLPVLERILGRRRNMFVAADGRRLWPSFGARGFTDVAPVRQHQLVQKSHALLEARLVTAAPLTPAQEDALRALILRNLPGGVEVRFAYLDAIARSANGKFEDFMSEVAA
jgi:phenylacetate-coenzyme A ligase PaaK-like adenylate-forming protein